MADRELNIFIRVKDFFTKGLNTLRSGVKKTEDPIDDLGKSIKRAGRSADEAQSTFGKFTAFLKARFVITLGDVVRGIRSVITGIIDLNKRAVEVEGVANAFKSLAESAGTTADVMLGKLAKATEGAISNFDLMSAANKASLLGLGLSTKQMSSLAAGAVQLGKAMGQTATASLNDLIVGLGRQSKLILDNLGLMINITKANQDYAASIDKTVEALTDQEKKTAFITAGIKAVQEGTDRLEKTGARPFEKISASLTNLTDRIATTITSNKGFNESLNELATILASKQLSDNLASIASGMASIASAGLNVIPVLQNVALNTKFIFEAASGDLQAARKTFTQLQKLAVQRALNADQEARFAQIERERGAEFLARVKAELEATRTANAITAEDRVAEEARITAATTRAEKATIDKRNAFLAEVAAATTLTEKLKLLTQAEKDEADAAEGGADAATKAAAALGIRIAATAQLAEEARISALREQLVLLERLNEESKGQLVTDLELLEARLNFNDALRGDTIPVLEDVGRAAAAIGTRTQEGVDQSRAALSTLDAAARNTAATFRQAGQEAGQGFADGVEAGVARTTDRTIRRTVSRSSVFTTDFGTRQSRFLSSLAFTGNRVGIG